MKLYIPLKDIVIAPGKRFDPAIYSEKDVIERIRRIYGVIADIMDISLNEGIVEIEFRDATPEKFELAMTSLKEGVKEAEKGRLSKALNLLQNVLTIIPENVAARRNIAKIYLQQNKLEKAKQYLHVCIQIDPKDADSYTLLANIYGRNENKYDLAAFYYEKCLEQYPEDAKVITNYAALKMEQKEFQEAEILFKKAINIEDVPNAYYGLALLYRMANLLEPSLQVLEQFFSRTDKTDGLDGTPIYQEIKKLYVEIRTALGVPKSH